VDRGTQRLGETAVVQRAGVAALVQVGLVRNDIERIRGDPDAKRRRGAGENARRRETRPPQPDQLLGRPDLRHRRRAWPPRPGVVRSSDAGRHRAPGADEPRANAADVVPSGRRAGFLAVGFTVTTLVFLTASAPAGLIRARDHSLHSGTVTRAPEWVTD